MHWHSQWKALINPCSQWQLLSTRNREIIFPPLPGKAQTYVTVSADLFKLTCMTCTIHYVSSLVMNFYPAEDALAHPRGEGRGGKTKHFARLTPDKLTSDGASCSASGPCWVEQLSVESRTEQRKPQVSKQTHGQPIGAVQLLTLTYFQLKTFAETAAVSRFLW